MSGKLISRLLKLHFSCNKSFQVKFQTLLTLDFDINGHTCWNEARFGSDPTKIKQNKMRI